MTNSEEQPQQLINGELKPLSGMESTSNIPVIKSKAEYLKAVMYEGVRLLLKSRTPPQLFFFFVSSFQIVTPQRCSCLQLPP
jgi:hypothetical protein